MRRQIEYSPSERFWLGVVGVFGLLAVNGAFLYGLLVQPDCALAK